MTKEERTIEINIKITVDSFTKEFIRETLNEINNQIYSMNREEQADEFEIGNEVYDEICELYCGEDDEEEESLFADIGDYISVMNDLDNLNRVLSCLGIPNIVFDGVGYCYNGGYYKIDNIGDGKMTLNVTPVAREDLDPICVKLLEHQV